MPTVSAGGKVLVTGANGYVASWVIRALLESGYSVRGTVRTEEKGIHLRKLFSDHQQNFELIVIEDITKEGAFNEALIGIDAVEHTAAPFHFMADDPQEVITPAVEGTLSLMRSALNVSSLKRIVVLSSTAAVLSILQNPKPFTEFDWNEQSLEDVKKNGKSASAISKYCASKTLGEKAAWELYEANKTRVSWDLVTLNPPYIFGPIIHDVTDIKNLNTSTGDWYNSVVRADMGGKSINEITGFGNGWIDVRDVGLAHVLVLQKERAGGERLIICKEAFVYQDFIDAASSLSPSPIPSHKDLPKGIPGAGRTAKPMFPFDSSKASVILGPELVYHSKEECTRDMLTDFEERGW
ncbi:D-lactaldehyde dehydrogenase [Gymnopus androsaceus JB14]|uniref:D-lactaldehyde dehydrogenase n=1 Tax=Gymnopus androsaceus JB14 TaxID=1447944 RepID=A0A6A4H260_9AGAR|nr:D-lactaldehyde dehydrogenase [Gymnopus androsaceus JB14]